MGEMIFRYVELRLYAGAFGRGIKKQLPQYEDQFEQAELAYTSSLSRYGSWDNFKKQAADSNTTVDDLILQDMQERLSRVGYDVSIDETGYLNFALSEEGTVPVIEPFRPKRLIGKRVEIVGEDIYSKEEYDVGSLVVSSLVDEKASPKLIALKFNMDFYVNEAMGEFEDVKLRDESYRDIIHEFISQLENSPPLILLFHELVEDFFGHASPNSWAPYIALHQSVINNQKHEITAFKYCTFCCSINPLEMPGS